MRTYIEGAIVRRLVVALLVLLFVPAVFIATHSLDPTSGMPDTPIPACHADEGIARPCPPQP